MIDITDYSSVNMKNYSLPKKNYKAYFELIAKNNSQVSENNGNLYLYFRNRAVSVEGNPSISYADFSSLINSNLGITIKNMEITQDTLATYLWIASGVVLDNFKFRFAIFSENETDLTYVKHQEDNYILPIQQEMLNKDYFAKEADGWKEVHLRDKRIIKEDIENAVLSTTNNFIYVSILLQNIAQLPSTNSIDVNVISNIAQHSSYNDMSDALIKYGIGISNVGSLCIRIKDCSTLEEYKEALSNDDFYYYYYLATPTKIACTEEQSAVLDKLNNLDLFKNTNNIITAEDIALLSLKYVADTKTYIDNKYNQLANQILEIVGGN